MRIIPRLKKETELGYTVSLPNPLPVFVNGEAAVRAFDVFTLFCDGTKLSFITVDARQEAFLCFEIDEGLADRAEQYCIRATEAGVTLSFAEFAGGRNAAATLYQMLRREGAGYVLPAAEILDYPDSRWRGVLLDTSWYFIPTDKIMDMLRQMALTKMNLLHFHLMDVRGYSLECEAYPELNDPERGFYTKEEMRQIIAFAARLGIDCMPEIEFVTHSKYLRNALPWLKCDMAHEETSRHALCIGKEETLYEFYRKVIAEVVEIFPFPILHVGSDEIEMYDLKAWPNWYDCPHCHALAKRVGIRLSTYEEVEARRADGTFLELGIDGVRPLFLRGVRKLYDIVKAAGKRMMMWNDNIDISKPTDLPRDILIHFWRIAEIHRGPHEGCSMEKFLEAGFEVVNSDAWETYVEADIYETNVPRTEWSPYVYPPVDPRYHTNLLGGEFCTWGADHLDYNMPGFLAYFSDRFWEKSPDLYGEDHTKALTRLLFGPDHAEGLRVYEAIGGRVIPYAPIKEGESRPLGHVERVTMSDGELDEVQCRLASMAALGGFVGRMAGYYAECVAWVRARRTTEKNEK